MWIDYGDLEYYALLEELEELLEDDEVDAAEAAFMRGYESE